MILRIMDDSCTFLLLGLFSNNKFSISFLDSTIDGWHKLVGKGSHPFRKFFSSMMRPIISMILKSSLVDSTSTNLKSRANFTPVPKSIRSCILTVYKSNQNVGSSSSSCSSTGRGDGRMSESVSSSPQRSKSGSVSSSPQRSKKVLEAHKST